MESLFDRIAKLPHKKLALLATELYERSRSAASEPIAITAMACRYPGGSDSPEAFWSFLESSGDAIERVPEDRLTTIGRSAEAMADSTPIWGGFLRQIDEFDPSVFGISAKEAEMMDPQQRLLLEVCWEALENSGTPVDAVDTDTGVFIGVSGIDFAMMGLQADVGPNGYMLTGAAHAVIAGRLSYVFGLNGPSTVLDTACSAAAAAIHLGCQSLRAGESSQVIAGGINLLLVPEMAQMLATMQVMASDGRCKVFSAEADGFVRAEGCGVIVLRRLSDAIARHEPILGVIRGTAWNQDGKSGGLTAPNGAAQERVIKAALADAGLSPDQISYVEAHGTGTALGDPIELSALGRVFDTATRQQPLIVGSVKTNIGHLEAAAGMPSIMKVLLALQHERIPPHLHATTLNPRIDWGALPLKIPTQAIDWPRGTQPRCAGVSAFGISGTNVHMVISEPPSVDEPEAIAASSSGLLTLSAKSHEALVALAGRYADALARRTDVDIAAFAAAANLKRAHFSHRLAVIASDSAQAEKELRRYSEGDAGGQASAAVVAGHRAPRIGVLFADAGPDAEQISGFHHAPAFRSAYDRWVSCLPNGRLGPVAATVGCQLALAELWRAWGIVPAVVAGEGCGEIAAAVIAGSLSEHEAAVLACEIDAGEQTSVTLMTPKIRLLTDATPDAARTMPLGTTLVTGMVRPRAQELCDRLITIRTANEDNVLSQLAAVYLAGVAVNWSEVHAGNKVDHALLPNYAFQRKRYWPEAFSRLQRTATDAAEATATAEIGGLYKVDWQRADARSDQEVPPAIGTVVLMHRAARSASAARSALEAAGLRVLERPISAAALSRSDVEALAATGHDASWLYLLPSGVGGEEMAGEARAALDDLLVIAQVLLELGTAAPLLRVVTFGAQSATTTVRPANAAMWGIGRVLAAEAPDVQTMFMDLDAGAPDWESLAASILTGRIEPEVTLLDGQALVPRLVPVELPVQTSDRLAFADASYIVTGAFGFIGELTTRWLVQQGAGKLFLVGHNPPREKALAAIEAARAAGADVETVIVDIGSAAGVDALFARVAAEPRPLRGIIHSAGALDDASIGRQTPASLSHALGAKATGAWLLHDRSVRHRLDFFVLYSSAAALVGTPGQANYAAANCYLDALAHYRRGLGLTALSLNWGLWVSTGLAIKREVVQSGSAQGAIPITPQQGMAILGRAIRSGETQVAVLPLDFASLRRAVAGRRAPTLMRGLLTTADDATLGEAVSSVLVSRYAEIYAACADAERSGLLVDFIRDRCTELLGLDPATPIFDEQPLLDIGLDSLVGLELRNDLQKVAGISCPSTLFFECPTLADLTRYFELIFSAPAPAAAAQRRNSYERISV